jgi:cyclophilin family peptidyl-prolyl cis-trans isomerase
MKHPAIVLLLLLFWGLPCPACAQGPVPEEIRAQFRLDDFYQKARVIDGFPIVSSSKVSDAALREAEWIVMRMTEHRPEIRKALAESGTRLAVMAHNEYTTDIPEHASLQPRVYWDRRARGLGATRDRPAVSCGEENLLGYEGDPYWNENICIHEFAHAIHEMALSRIEPVFQGLLDRAYDSAMEKGLWKGTYAASNAYEYFAEATQCWFDDNRENDALHNHVNTRSELREYDPDVARLCENVYGDLAWRYKKPALRSSEDVRHLGAWPVTGATVFRWREEPVPEIASVLVQTAIGDIELELDSKAAPATVANFLHYVHQGLYADGTFFRTVREDNQAENAVRIAVIQASADEKKKDRFPNAIPLERTRDTGLKHMDGTISMAREGPDSAQDHFFICIGDQPELDFGGKRNPDGQGFAAFGRVVKGMDVVRKIHGMKTNSDQPQVLAEPVPIQRAIRNN